MYVQDIGKLFIATGGDGKCYVYSGIPLRQLSVIDIGGDADNIRYDEAAKRIYVGYGDGALAVVIPLLWTDWAISSWRATRNPFSWKKPDRRHM